MNSSHGNMPCVVVVMPYTVDGKVLGYSDAIVSPEMMFNSIRDTDPLLVRALVAILLQKMGCPASSELDLEATLRPSGKVVKIPFPREIGFTALSGYPLSGLFGRVSDEDLGNVAITVLYARSHNWDKDARPYNEIKMVISFALTLLRIYFREFAETMNVDTDDARISAITETFCKIAENYLQCGVQMDSSFVTTDAGNDGPMVTCAYNPNHHQTDLATASQIGRLKEHAKRTNGTFTATISHSAIGILGSLAAYSYTSLWLMQAREDASTRTHRMRYLCALVVLADDLYTYFAPS